MMLAVTYILHLASVDILDLLKPNNIICHWVYNGGDGSVFLVVAVEIGCGTFFFLVEVILMGCILKIKFGMLSVL